MSSDQTQIFEVFISMPYHHTLNKVYYEGIINIEKHLSKYRVNIVSLDQTAYDKSSIEDNVLYHIDKADLVIADIFRYLGSATGNVSVMHEIGYATGRRTPVILIGGRDEYKHLPANLTGSLILSYDETHDIDYVKFSRDLAKQVELTISTNVLSKIRGEFPVEGFIGRNGVHLDRIIESASKRILILTTNLTYTSIHLIPSIRKAIDANKKDAGFKVEILTMDPESSVVNERARQLGKNARAYRDELRESLDKVENEFAKYDAVEIMAYTSFPTQMSFIVDNQVVVATVAMAQASRESAHFLISDSEQMGVEPFVAHFRAVKINRMHN